MNLPPSTRRADSVFSVAIWIALYALPILLAISPHLDADVWWHLRTGQWIVTHGEWPTSDPFSLYGQETGKPWIAYSWLFEVTLYGCYCALGYQGIVLFRVVLVLAVLAALHRLIGRREGRLPVAVGVTLVVFLALTPLLSERPWLFTIFACTLTLDAILTVRDGKQRKGIWLLPLLFALWANVHVQFVHGLLLLGLACAAPMLDRQRGVACQCPAGSRGWWRLVAVMVLCLAATLVNPYHVELYRVVREYAIHPAAYRHITEFQALGFRDVWDWCVLGLAGAAAFALGRRSARSSFEVLLLVAAAWFGFRTRRDLWFIVLASAAVIVTAIPLATTVRVFMPSRRQAVVLATALAVLAGLYWRGTLTDGEIEAATARHYPVQATLQIRELLAEQRCHGPLYNHFDWGGYLIWQLPELPVAIDGRSNLHGDDRLERMTATWQGLPGWDRDPELMRAGVVIVQARTGLASLLRFDERFELAYEDAVALVFIARAYSTR